MTLKLEKLTMKPWRVALAGLTLACVSPLTWAAAAIQSITTSLQAGSEVVRIELSEALPAVPAGFVVQTPPRIAIDPRAWSTSVRAICARSMWPRPVNAPAWCST